MRRRAARRRGGDAAAAAAGSAAGTGAAGPPADQQRRAEHQDEGGGEKLRAGEGERTDRAATAAQAARTARDAGVKLLALTHISTRYFPRDIRNEARDVFENTVVPRDFDSIEVPFPERGEPHLVKSELVEAAP